jgi:hypothetical protein
MTVEHSLPNRCFPPEITVVPWEDPIVEGPGHWPGDPYIEYCWLGVLGPSTTFLWARLARLGAEAPSTVVDVSDLAISLGLGEGLSSSAPLPRSLVRLVQFGCAHGTGREGLAVRLALPHVSPRQLGRLSSSARQAHEYLVQGASRTSR